MTTYISHHHLQSIMTPQKLPSLKRWQLICQVIICNQIWHPKNRGLIFKKMTTHILCHHLWLKMTLHKLQCDLWKDYNAKTMYLSAKRWAIKIFKMCCDLLTITTYFPRCHLSQICSRYLCCHLSQKMTLQFLRLNPYKDDTVKNAFLTVDHII